MKKIILYILIAFTILNPVLVNAENNTNTERITLSVAIPKQEGTKEGLEGEYLTGYTHEYLTKISQIAPIDFKISFFDTGNNEELLQVLNSVKNGEIDLMGSMQKGTSLDKDYLFSNVSYGESNTTIGTLETNEKNNDRTLKYDATLKIGLSEKATAQNSDFFNYCKTHNIKPTIVYYASFQLVLEALNNGEVDYILNKDTALSYNVKEVAKFGKNPYYFVTAKGNEKVIQLIDDAIFEVLNIEPNYNQYLFEKYYNQEDLKPSLTKEEISFIKAMQPLKIGIISNSRPLQYYDSESKMYKGILIDLMNEIARTTNLKVEYVLLGDLADLQDKMINDEIDAVLGIPTSYEISDKYNVLLSSVLIELPVVRIYNRYGTNAKDITAMSGYLNINNLYEKVYDDTAIIKGVANEIYKEGYLDGYRAQYLSTVYHNIDITPATINNYEVSIGLYRNEDSKIMTILEQGIKGIHNKIIENAVYNNVVVKEDISLMEYLKRDPAMVIFSIVTIASFLIVILLLFLLESQQMKKAITDERKKYAILAQFDQLTNVYNQQTFKEKVQKSILKGNKGILVLMDVDNFKDVNDQLGHLEGDYLLNRIGTTINEIFQSYTIGRIGGDEFMIYLEQEVDVAMVENKLNQLSKKLNQTQDNYSVTLSIGVSVFDKAKDFNEVYKHADGLLYAVKSEGRNNIKVDKLQREINLDIL